MPHARHLAIVSSAVLSLALAACSGAGEEEQAAPAAGADTAPAESADAAVPAATETPAAEATPDAAASATPTPPPSATATAAAAPAARPTQVAAAAPATPPPAFATCSACHSVQRGENGIGPTLAGVVGRRSGTVAGFGYSDAMRGANLTWNEANLDRYLANPTGVVPGTTMPINLADAAQRRAVIAYLKTL